MMTQTPATSSVSLFLSYAHEDEVWLNKLRTHLSLLRRQGIISDWHDRQLVPGTDWSRTIDQRLEQASLILLLVSADFLASNYCYEVEMQRALKLHEVGKARVLPIIVRPCDWKTAPFAHLQVLPTDAKPLSLWHDPDAALANVVEGLRRALGALSFSLTSTVSSQSNVTPAPNIPPGSFLTENTVQFVTQSSQLPGTVPPLPPTTQEIFETQSDQELFKKDRIFEEYIIKMVQKETIPDKWRIYQPSRLSPFVGFYCLGQSLLYGFFTVLVGINLLVGKLLLPTEFFTIGYGVWTAFLSFVLSVALTIAIYKRVQNYLVTKMKKMLVLTPNGCIYFEKGLPLSMIRYSMCKNLQFVSPKIMAFTSIHVDIDLINFAIPATIYQQVDAFYQDFKKGYTRGRIH